MRGLSTTTQERQNLSTMARIRPYYAQNDLDDMLRNLQRRLSSIFGRSGGSMNNSHSNNNHYGRNLLSAAIILLAIWIGSGVYLVDAQERAVVLRFGHYIQTVGPGYNWHLPWPIERRLIVNVSQQYSIPDDANMLTADINLVEVKSAVQYTQPDAYKYLFSVHDNDPRETLGQVSESAMREAIGRASLDRALARDPAITELAKQLLQSTLDRYDMGIRILSVNLTDVNVPEGVQDAQRDAIKASKDRDRIQQDAETFRNGLLPRARGDAAKEVLDAEAYRAQVSTLAQGETSRFDQVLAQYERAPQVTRERIYLDTMGAVLKGTRKVVVDTKNGNSMMYLPLDKLFVPAGATSGEGLGQQRIPEIQVQPSDDASRARGVR
jgi:membrane protease subunit HflK